jgi:hypothetical protein
VLCFGIVGFPRDSVLTSLRDVIRARWQSGVDWCRGYANCVVYIKYKMKRTYYGCEVQSITTICIVCYAVEFMANIYYSIQLHVSALSTIVRL